MSISAKPKSIRQQSFVCILNKKLSYMFNNCGNMETKQIEINNSKTKSESVSKEKERQ